MASRRRSEDRERLVPPSGSGGGMTSSSPWDDDDPESVGNILRRTRTTSRSEQEQRQQQQEQRRRQSRQQQQRRRSRQLQQQDEPDAIRSAEPVDPVRRLEERIAADRAQEEEEDEGEALQLGGCAGSCFCHPRSLCHRLIALFLMSAIGFGSYFCFDNPGALQDVMRDELRITAYQFSLFYAWYSMPNTVLPIIGGYLIDGVFGMRLATIVYASIIVVGQALFAVGAYYGYFSMMEIARFVFGVGGESLAVAQNTYAVAWFKEKELNMVFGFQLAVARVGSSVNFWTVGKLFHYLEDQVGMTGTHALGVTLGVCCGTCIASLICGIVLAWQDKRKERLTSPVSVAATEGDKPSLYAMLLLPGKFWLLSIICMVYYSAVFPFVSLGQVFVLKKYDFSASDANFAISIIYVLSAPLSPIMGWMIDKWGRNIGFVFVAVAASLVAHVLFAFTFINPWLGIVVLGVGYSLLASALWPIVALIVPENTLGTAYGVMQALQNGGMALLTMAAGKVVDSKGYLWLELFFCANLAVALVCTVFLWVLDQNDTGYLNMSVSQREEFKEAKRKRKEERERRKHEDNPNRPRDQNEIRRRYLSRIGAALPAHLGMGRTAVNANLVLSPSTPVIVGSHLGVHANMQDEEAQP